MEKQLRIMPGRAGLWLVLAGVSMCAVLAGQEQDIPALPAELPRTTIQRKLSDRVPEKPSLKPAFTIPVQPLGFSAPGLFYVGSHNCLASLDFLDENRLLFSFQVPGLMHRETGDTAGIDERRIRAVVVALPAGKVESDALWTLHDRAHYLWMLKNGHFLLRDRESLEEGDAKLEMKPYMHFPGRLLWLEMDPAQQVMETNFLEPEAAGQKPGKAESPAAAQPSSSGDGRKPDLKPVLVVRTVKRETDQIVQESRVGLTVQKPTSSDGYMEVEAGMLSGRFQHIQLPINSEGYLESSSRNGQQWLLRLRYFSGGGKDLDSMDSTCQPTFGFVSEGEFLVTACDVWGGWDVAAWSTGGDRLWAVRTTDREIWPLLVRSLDGARVARETVVLNHPIKGRRARILNPEDVKGQVVRVFDAADGMVALESPASPTLDAGGNVAISPSGRRVAVLNDGAIQVFELPAPAPLPKSVRDHSER